MIKRSFALKNFAVASLIFALAISLRGAEAIEKPVEFSEHLIRDGYGYAYGIAAADLDDDGDLDLVSSDTTDDVMPKQENGTLFWFENDGKGNFTQHIIAKNEPGWFERMAVGDIDGDGNLDVVLVLNKAGGVIWFRNPGKPAGRLWRRYTIVEDGGLPRAYDVALGDFDGDGRLDVATSSWKVGNRFVWYRNPGRDGFKSKWPAHLIEEGLGETRTIESADFNGDGRPDLLGTASAASLAVWYENTGKPGELPKWKKHIIDDQSPAPIHGHASDVDGDGDADVVMAFGMRKDLADVKSHEIVWFENVGKPGRGTEWKKHLVGPMPYAFEAIAADVDGDKKLDIIATSWGKAGELVLFRHSADGETQWTKQVLKANWPNANQVIAADLDNDGRMDLIAEAERGANEVRWWRDAPGAKSAESKSLRKNTKSKNAQRSNDIRSSNIIRDIGSLRQLFIDDYLIDSMTSLKRSFHGARKHGPPVIVPEYPWEGVGTAPWPSVFLFGDVIWDESEKLYKMWYTSATKDSKGQHSALYATSKDGIHWVKPMNLGIVEYQGSTSNNILLRNCSVENVLRVDSEPDPARRYQFFAYDRNVNAYAWRFSADGIHWGNPVPVPLLKGMYDVGNVAYDETRKLYVLAVKESHNKTYVHPVLGKHPLVPFRHWFMSSSKDLENWSPLLDMLGDFDETDKTLYMQGERCSMLNTYGVSLFAYNGVYLGIQWMFRITDAAGFWGCNGGPMDGRLLFSREWNKPWQIPSHEFVIPHGRKGEWDWGMICGIANRPVVSPDGNEWWYYYGGWDGDHGISTRRACIGLAKLRVDGFASIDSLGTEGILATPKLKFTGSELSLNVNASGEDTAGEKNFVQVELLDENGEVLKGFSKDDCDAIRENSVNRTVTWKEKRSLAELAGRVIQMKIYIRGAELYALQFVNG